jgi:hypothetical protein
MRESQAERRRLRSWSRSCGRRRRGGLDPLGLKTMRGAGPGVVKMVMDRVAASRFGFLRNGRRRNRRAGRERHSQSGYRSHFDLLSNGSVLTSLNQASLHEPAIPEKYILGSVGKELATAARRKFDFFAKAPQGCLRGRSVKRCGADRRGRSRGNGGPQGSAQTGLRHLPQSGRQIPNHGACCPARK